jgi:hypothetical protein
MNAEKPEYLFPEDNPFKATYTFFPIKSYLWLQLEIFVTSAHLLFASGVKADKDIEAYQLEVHGVWVRDVSKKNDLVDR